MGTGTLSAADFIKKASHTAHHFGFRHLEDITKDARCTRPDKKQESKILVAERRLDALQGLLTLGASAYFERGLGGIGEPLHFYSIEETPRTGEIAVSLHVVGVEKSIAEALLMHTIRALYRELSLTEYTVHINSLGDRESLSRYIRELGNYLKKRIDFMPPAARELMKEHALLALTHLIERDHELGVKSPSPLEYLNEQSRKHFREIIEYLDFTGTSYNIDTRLLGHHQCYAHTLFSVDAYLDETREVRAPIDARGGRYDTFMQEYGKRSVPAVGAVITLKERKAPARIPRHKPDVPSIFIVQLGFGPKLRSLSIIEELHGAGIPVHQALASDSLSTQLERARQHNVPYTLILGQKEYVEGNVIVRDMRSSSQEHVALSNLVPHLRRAIRA